MLDDDLVTVASFHPPGAAAQLRAWRAAHGHAYGDPARWRIDTGRGGTGEVSRVLVPRHALAARVPQLLTELRSPEWSVASTAATALQEAPGEDVTRALAAALDAADTAVTQAAIDSLLARDEWVAVELIWQMLGNVDDDLQMHIWSFLDDWPEHRIAVELGRRADAEAD